MEAMSLQSNAARLFRWTFTPILHDGEYHRIFIQLVGSETAPRLHYLPPIDYEQNGRVFDLTIWQSSGDFFALAILTIRGENVRHPCSMSRKRCVQLF